MLVKKINQVLTKKEIRRLRWILNKEVKKPKNNKYYATLLMFIEDLEEISFHKHYSSLYYFLKYYKKKIDLKIKNKIKLAYDARVFDIEKYRKNVKQKFHKYVKKDFKLFLNQSQYFFSLYKSPFNLKNIKNKDYLNRVYLGLGFEFLLKAIFLKKGYLINDIDYELLKKKKVSKPSVPTRLGSLKKEVLLPRLKEFNYFIQEISKIKPNNIDDRDFNYYVLYGLIIVQNWRNQDLHTPTGYFSLDNVQYHSIKTAYNSLYKLFLKKFNIPKFP